MRTHITYHILLIVLSGLMLGSCDRQTQRYDRAQSLYEEGVQLRSQRLSEEAAERFLQALEVTRRCEKTNNVLLLEGQIYDNIGAMYHKHSLFDAALTMHLEAIKNFRQVQDSIDLIMAYRNCGRVENILEHYSQSKHYFDTAFQIATLLNNEAMLRDLYLEMARDYYLPTENYPKAIEYINRAMEGGLPDNDLDIANMTLGVIFYYTNDYPQAKIHLHEALRSERSGLKMSVYQTLYAIAYNEGDFPQAMEYQDLFTQYMMQSDQEHNSETMQRIKAEYELKAQKSEMESMHRNKSLKLYLLITLIIIALLIITLVVRRKIALNKLEMERIRGQVERDQNRIHTLVSDMETLIRTNDELRRDQQTLSQKELLMTQKILSRNKVFATAQVLSEQVTADTMNFVLTDNDWSDFISLTDLVFDGFSQRLLQLYPKLGKWDVRICCLSKNGFSNQVISILLDTQTDSYYKRKTRIKQLKMNLPDDNRTFEEIVNAV